MKSFKGIFFIAFFLFLSALCIYADTLTVPLPETNFNLFFDGEGYTSFKGDTLVFPAKPGEPMLPCREVTVLLPPDTDLDSLEIKLQNFEEIRIEGEHQIRPAGPELFYDDGKIIEIWPEEKRIIDGRDTEIYSGYAFFPEKNTVEIKKGYLRSYCLATVTVCLVRYNPAEKSLVRLSGGEICLSWYKNSISALSAAGRSVSADYIGAERVMKIAGNYDDMAGLYPAAPAAADETGPSTGYVIITTEDIITNSSDAINHFCEVKQGQGYDVSIQPLEGMGIPGDTIQEKIRNWLKDYWLSWNIEYVLLIGNPDTEKGDVPMYMGSFSVPNDRYYAELTGDEYFDIVVGRIPVYPDDPENGYVGSEVLDRILNKTSAYITADPADTAWRNNVFLPINPFEEAKPETDIMYMMAERIKENSLVPNGYDSYRIYELDYSVGPEDYPCTYENVRKAWCKPDPDNPAAEQFGAVILHGHGCPDHTTDVISISMTRDLDDDYPAMVLFCSCSTGKPEAKENLAYAVLSNGAIAAVAPTRDYGQLISAVENYADALFGDNAPIGYAALESIPNHRFNVLGDPSLSLGDDSSFLALKPQERYHNQNMEGGTINIRTERETSWNAVSNDPSWITISSADSGSGSGTLTYSVSENSSGDKRSGSISVNSKTFSVYQSAARLIKEFPLIDDPMAEWIDIDNDNDLDIVIGGEREFNPLCYLYINNGSDGSGGWKFDKIPENLDPLKMTSIESGDFNNDGKMDLVISGLDKDYKHHIRIFLNRGADGPGWKFDKVYDKLTTSLDERSSLTLADMDGNGTLDVFVRNRERPVFILNRGPDKDGLPILETAEIDMETTTDYQLCDFDNDGDIDIIYSVKDETEKDIIKFAANSGPSAGEWLILSDAGQIDLPGSIGFIRSMDVNSDGRVDLLSTGRTEEPGYIDIYLNLGTDGSGNPQFEIRSADLHNYGIAYRSPFVDYDYDGDLDIISGSGVLENIGPSGSDKWEFQPEEYWGFWGDSKWADFDTDGDLDLVIIGRTNTEVNVAIYANTGSAKNNNPSTPSGLSVSLSGNSALLSWNKAWDNGVQQDGLTYNVVVSKTPGGVEILSPEANLVGGFRRTAGPGNTANNTFMYVHDLEPGTYYWGVQTIDNGLGYSMFNFGDSFFIGPAAKTFRRYEGSTQIACTADHGFHNPVDINNDGLPDILASSIKQEHTTLYINAGPGPDNNPVFKEFQTTIPGLGFSANLGYGDFDNDGDIDIAVSGFRYIPTDDSEKITAIYRNDGKLADTLWKFTEYSAGFLDVADGDVSWTDFDNDGDLDLYVSGHESFDYVNILYRNDGAAGEDPCFAEIDTTIENNNEFKCIWKDFDNDGDLDVLQKGTGTEFSRILRNDGTNGENSWKFTDMGIAIAELNGPADCADYDNDGDIDFILSGYGATGYQTMLYENRTSDGSSWDFSETQINELSGFKVYDLCFADFDNDGWTDIYYVTRRLYIDYARILRNEKAYGGTFSDAGLISTRRNAVWCDIDGDKDLDVLLGYNASFYNDQHYFRIYLNNGRNPNTRPFPPYNLTQSINGNSVKLSWKSGSDNQTPEEGLNYNLRLGTNYYGIDIVSPNASQYSGTRRISAPGIQGERSGDTISWTITSLEAGRYYWSVQAIDSSNIGSYFPWSQSFVINPQISGRITFEGAGVGGVELRGLPGNPVTDSTGYYQATVSEYWSGSVTPYKAGEYFQPGSRNYTNVTSNQLNQDYEVTEAPAADLRLQYKTSNLNSTSNTISMSLRIYNDGDANVLLEEIKASYWYSAEVTNEEEINKDWVGILPSGQNITGQTQVALAELSPELSGQDRRLDISFANGTGVITPGGFVEIQLRIHDKSYQQNYYQSNDYSFTAVSSHINWTKITVDYAGSTVWGTAP